MGAIWNYRDLVCNIIAHTFKKWVSKPKKRVLIREIISKCIQHLLRKINGFSGSYHDLWKPGESCGCILFVFIGFLLTEICKEMQVIFVANSLHKQIYTLEEGYCTSKIQKTWAKHV